MAVLSGIIPLAESLIPLAPGENLIHERYTEMLKSRSLEIPRMLQRVSPIQGIGTSTYIQRILIPDETHNRILIGPF